MLFRSCALALLVAGGAPAETIELSAVRDCAMFENDNSSGAGDLFVGRTGNGGGALRQRSLIRFDFSAIPAGASVDAVSLRLELWQSGGTQVTSEIGLHLCLADWGEGTSVANGGLGGTPTAGDATWTNRFHPGDPWAMVGGDYSATASSMLAVTSVLGPQSWPSTPELVADVQGWLDGDANYGWCMVGPEIIGSARRFLSREVSDAAARPTLIVEYSLPCVGDIDDSGDVGFDDLLALLAAWGPCKSCPADLDDDGDVDFDDLLALLTAWGDC